jgi:hypothetical protein
MKNQTSHEENPKTDKWQRLTATKEFRIAKNIAFFVASIFVLGLIFQGIAFLTASARKIAVAALG